MRIVFAGTPEAAVPALRALAASHHDVALVVTRPDAPLGRKRVLTPSPIATAAAELGLPVLKTARLGDDATEQITAAEAELGVIVAYGGLVREPLLSSPTRGWVNLHFSLLPAWRGAAPVQRALIAGDAQLGWAVFQLVAALDAGDVFVQEAYTPAADDTAADVLADLARIGGDRLPAIVDEIAAGAVPVPQSGEPTVAPKLSLEDGRLDFSERAETVYACYRGVTPEPGAFFTVDGLTIKAPDVARSSAAAPLAPGELAMLDKRVLVGTGTEPLELRRVQPAGKPAMAAGDWWRGLRVDSLQADLPTADAS